MPRSRLTETLASRRPAGHSGWRVRDAPSARAASLASSAALLTHPATPLPSPTSGGDPYVIPHVNPYVIPYALGSVPLASLAERIGAGQSPLGGSGAATPQGALRAIDPCGAAAILTDLRSAPPAAAI